MSSPANGPGPVTRINISPYTNAGIVRIAIINTRKISATGFGIRFAAARKESGIDNTAPTIVPKNAIHMVSSNRYATPDVERSNNNPVSGWKIPLMIFPATERPLPFDPVDWTVESDHASNAATIKATMIFAYQVFGSCSYIFLIDSFILPVPPTLISF